MDITALMESMASFKQEVPAEVGILELRRSSVDELQRRLRKWLKAGSDACEKNFDRGDWTTFDDRTRVRLPQGALAVIYHASGAVKFSAGLAPMEFLFKEMEPKAKLAERAEIYVKSLGLRDSLGRGETLGFEGLWQIKAAGADRSGKPVDAVLCRAVSAFRHHVEGIPVLGPASVAVQIAGDGVLDSVSTLMRGPTAQVLEKAKVLHPERALRQIGQQLGGSSLRLPEPAQTQVAAPPRTGVRRDGRGRARAGAPGLRDGGVSHGALLPAARLAGRREPGRTKQQDDRTPLLLAVRPARDRERRLCRLRRSRPCELRATCHRRFRLREQRQRCTLCP
jgi:hypothetical protein